MAQYTVYLVSKRNGRLLPCYSFKASTDEAAEEFVRERQTDEVVELWHGSRKIARFERPPNDGSASSLWL
jgi:hypothetical protein